MNSENVISPKVQNVLNLIEQKEMEWHEYVHLYENASNYEYITDYERELILDNLIVILRTKFPKKSSKILGNKSTDALELLGGFLNIFIKEFNLENNRVGNHVKAGGSMISGEEFICWYLSYKNNWGWSCGIGYHQKSPNDLPYLEVVKKEIKKNSSFEPKVKLYQLSEKEVAFQKYRNYLNEIIE